MPKAKDSDADELTVTTFRITREQLYWLRDQANQRAKVRGRGRSDMSGIVRELITKAMNGREC